MYHLIRNHILLTMHLPDLLVLLESSTKAKEKQKTKILLVQGPMKNFKAKVETPAELADKKDSLKNLNKDPLQINIPLPIPGIKKFLLDSRSARETSNNFQHPAPLDVFCIIFSRIL